MATHESLKAAATTMDVDTLLHTYIGAAVVFNRSKLDETAMRNARKRLQVIESELKSRIGIASCAPDEQTLDGAEAAMHAAVAQLFQADQTLTDILSAITDAYASGKYDYYRGVPGATSQSALQGGLAASMQAHRTIGRRNALRELRVQLDGLIADDLDTSYVPGYQAVVGILDDILAGLEG